MKIIRKTTYAIPDLTSIKIIVFLMSYFIYPNLLKSQTFNENFAGGYNGWTGDFADYPVNDSVFYQLEFTRENLPSPLNQQEFGLKTKGNNHSDDLFMFIKKKITGLNPNSNYQLIMEVTFASKAPTNAIGIGGPPGEGVTLKAGASITEPKKIIEYGDYRMNIDKGNQSQSGKDMEAIGHVGISDTTSVFNLKTLSNSATPRIIQTGPSGEIWVCFGTDSGFEGTSTIFYHTINLEFREISTDVQERNPSNLMTFPNPAEDIISITANKPADLKLHIMNKQGLPVKIIGREDNYFMIDIHELPAGIYYLRSNRENVKAHKFIKK